MLHQSNDSNMLKRNIPGQHKIENVKSTCILHGFEFQLHSILHIVQKGEICMTSHYPL